MENKAQDPNNPQVLKRSIGTVLAASAVGGASAGVAGAVTQQVISKLPKKPKK